jgi:hypothetical protein
VKASKIMFDQVGVRCRRIEVSRTLIQIDFTV